MADIKAKRVHRSVEYLYNIWLDNVKSFFADTRILRKNSANTIPADARFVSGALTVVVLTMWDVIDFQKGLFQPLVLFSSQIWYQNANTHLRFFKTIKNTKGYWISSLDTRCRGQTSMLGTKAAILCLHSSLTKVSYHNIETSLLAWRDAYPACWCDKINQYWVLLY